MGASFLISTRTAFYSVVQASLPGMAEENCGVLLLDTDSNELYLRFRRDWELFAGEESEVLSLLADDLERRARETGARELVEELESSLSNVIRITDRQPVLVADFEKALNRLYAEHVQSNVLEFRTHVPLRSMRAAAGGFGDDMADADRGWIEVPQGIRISRDMFVARISGRSMEPLIPADSLCLFRQNPKGTRQGKILLVQRGGTLDTGGEVTIKRYQSYKVRTEEGWQHERIRMIPENPEFDSWDLDPEDPLRVIAEFLCVLEYPEPVSK
jgi:phage repressor protein C with HTH and peptisase S24 domain